MTAPERSDERWDDWESNRKRQLAVGLEVTPAERPAWLVAMIELAWRSGALPRPRGEDPLGWLSMLDTFQPWDQEMGDLAKKSTWHPFPDSGGPLLPSGETDEAKSQSRSPSAATRRKVARRREILAR